MSKKRKQEREAEDIRREATEAEQPDVPQSEDAHGEARAPDTSEAQAHPDTEARGAHHALRADVKRRRQASRRIGTPTAAAFRRKRHPVRATLAALAMVSVIGAVFAYLWLDVASWQKLDVRKITAAAQTGSLLDSEGALITEIRGAENRVSVPLSALSEQTRQVFLAAEDLRFYQHHGVDVVRVFGAIVANIREGGYAQGASTITQQLIRQSHLSLQKTIARKLEEIWLAVQLEQRFSKDEILEMYLNYIYFGNGAYGIQAAAQTYFDVDARELTLQQAAALAGALKAPGVYAPHVSEANNRGRRSYILDTMLEQGMIGQAEHDEAARAPLELKASAPAATPYGWFVDAALDEAARVLGVSDERVLTGGYHIHTTLSRAHQDELDKRFEKSEFPSAASDGTKVQGAAACVNTRTGEVLAIVGGRSYDVRRGFNRATQLKRQPGSSLKPLVAYAPAIDRFGYMTASVLRDEPTNFNGYKPRNSGYAYYGNVSFRSALSSSLNVAAVSLLDRIGVQAGRAYLEKVGIPLDERDQNLALALGAMTYGVSPVQLAAAYAPFGNGGTYSAPHFISKITDTRGTIVYAYDEGGTRVLSAQSAYLMTSLLTTVTTSGTGAKLSGAGTPVAGKTGTVNMAGGNRDIWMACYNSEISCAFWMGFDQPDSAHKLQSWVSGGDHTAAMARDYFHALYAGKSKPQFERPDGIVALEIDKQAIKWRGEPMLAAELTPKQYRYTEYFTTDNRPTRTSDVWTPPRTPNSFTVGHNEAGYPLLKIQPADSAIYRIQRDAIGESFILTELYGTAGETLYYADTRAQANVVYTYRVIPVHAELLNSGILLEGVQAVQVAQARLAGSRNALDSVLGFLFGETASPGREEAAGESVENTSSLFWTD